MSGWVAGGIVVGALISASSSNKAIKSQEKLNEGAVAEQKAARESLEKRIAKYEKSEFKPLDLDALKQENLFEEMDMTKDAIPAADYAREQFAQQQANIMSGLRGAAGGSGIAGLAQSLSMQAKDQARQTSINLGTILSQNRRAALSAQQSINTQERQVKIANMEGQNAFELDKMATLMGVSGQRAYAAGQTAASAQSNMIALQTAQAQANAQYWQAGVTALGQVNWGTTPNTNTGGFGPGGWK